MILAMHDEITTIQNILQKMHGKLSNKYDTRTQNLIVQYEKYLAILNTDFSIELDKLCMFCTDNANAALCREVLDFLSATNLKPASLFSSNFSRDLRNELIRNC